MNIVNWDPFREMEETFNSYNQRLGMPMRDNSGRQVFTPADWSPALDIAETDKEFLIKVELPEVKKEDVKVTIDDGVLNIEGEPTIEKEEKDGKKYHRIERLYGRFARSFSLPDNVKQSDIKAEFRDGMLKVRLEKSAKTKPKSIEVEVAA